MNNVRINRSILIMLDKLEECTNLNNVDDLGLEHFSNLISY
ncbi:MAG: hypothetical protein AB8U25_00790 [Rickettsiales endosymbiont of Dermacentor nuttalli]